MFFFVRSATTSVWPLVLLYSHHHHYANSLFSRQINHAMFRQHSSLSPIIDLNENIKWTSYIAPMSKAIIKIAEVVDIDPIMDYTIEKGLPEPFGIVTWDSSYTIADLLDTEYHNSTIASLSGKTVCDVGCGTGLASLLCLTYGANVIALDFNQYSLQLGRISYNRYRAEKHCVEMDKIALENSVDFRYYDLMSSKELPNCELLLISDVTYYDSLAVIVAARYVRTMTELSEYSYDVQNKVNIN